MLKLLRLLSLALISTTTFALPTYFTFEGQLSISSTGMMNDSQWLSQFGIMVDPSTTNSEVIDNQWVFMVDLDATHFEGNIEVFESFDYLGMSATEALYATDSGPKSRERYACNNGPCGDLETNMNKWDYQVSYGWASSTVMLEGFTRFRDLAVGDQFAIWEFYQDLNQVHNSHLIGNSTGYSLATLTSVSTTNPFAVSEPGTLMLVLLAMMLLVNRKSLIRQS